MGALCSLNRVWRIEAGRREAWDWMPQIAGPGPVSTWGDLRNWQRELSRWPYPLAHLCPVAVPMTQYTSTVNGVHIAYQVTGSGPWDLVFIPSAISHIETYWEEPTVSRYLNRLASFSRLLLFDKRGVGMSDRIEGVPTLEERMDDVRAVMDAASSVRATILGMSEGGAIAAMFAATYPERVQGLILLNAAVRCWVPQEIEPLIDEYLEQSSVWASRAASLPVRRRRPSC